MKHETIQRFIEIPLSEVQTEKGRNNWDGSGTTCILCGKKLIEGKTKQVHFLTNGNIVSYSGSDVENSQGFFPVGNECAKKLVIQFAF